MNKMRHPSISTEYIYFPCGRCGPCLVSRSLTWQFRLHWENKRAVSAFFVTLTYDPTTIEYSEYGMPTISKHTLQKFIKRIRKQRQTWIKKYSKPSHLNYISSALRSKKIRYYAIGEYGDKFGRPHYHVILFNVSARELEKIQDVWKLGAVHTGDVEPASIGYVCKYHITAKENEHANQFRQKPFALMSKRPEIGSNYLDHNKDYHLIHNSFHAIFENKPVMLPKKWIDRLFPDAKKRRLQDEKSHEQMRAEWQRWVALKEKGISDPWARDLIHKQEKNRQILKYAHNSKSIL